MARYFNQYMPADTPPPSRSRWIQGMAIVKQCYIQFRSKDLSMTCTGEHNNDICKLLHCGSVDTK